MNTNIVTNVCKTYESFEFLQPPMENLFYSLSTTFIHPIRIMIFQHSNSSWNSVTSLVKGYLCMKKLIFFGDFNFHLNDLTCKDAFSFTTLLSFFILHQHISVPIPSKEHTLDLIITLLTDFCIPYVAVNDM